MTEKVIDTTQKRGELLHKGAIWTVFTRAKIFTTIRWRLNIDLIEYNALQKIQKDTLHIHKNDIFLSGFVLYIEVVIVL